jgi:TolB protein
VDLDGTGLVNLTESMDATDFDYPSWSPDGTSLAFYSNASDGAGIYLLNSDGTALTRLADGPGLNTQPAWSPDGSMIAFRRSHLSEQWWQWHLVVISTDGTAEHIVASDLGEQGSPSWTTISWSPDSRRIAFTMWADTSAQVFVVDADGSGITQLTFPESHPRDYAWEPSWSPDGRLIAFSRATGIYAVTLDGAQVGQLIRLERGARLAYPGWSPAGTRIIAYTEHGLYELTLGAPYPQRLSYTWPICATLSPGASMVSYLSPIGDVGVAALSVTDFETMASWEVTEFSPVSLSCPVWQP